MEESGFEIADKSLVDEIVADKLLLDELYAALDELSDDERSLIDALYFDEKSERSFADEIGLSQKAVNKRRHRVLGNCPFPRKKAETAAKIYEKNEGKR